MPKKVDSPRQGSLLEVNTGTRHYLAIARDYDSLKLRTLPPLLVKTTIKLITRSLI
jgi:hypothetical protein